MKVDISKAEVMSALQEKAKEYNNMCSVKLTDEDANDVIRAMSNKAISLNDAVTEIIEGILTCLFLEIV